jgi:hypothetical protein
MWPGGGGGMASPPKPPEPDPPMPMPGGGSRPPGVEPGSSSSPHLLLLVLLVLLRARSSDMTSDAPQLRGQPRDKSLCVLVCVLARDARRDRSLARVLGECGVPLGLGLGSLESVWAARQRRGEGRPFSFSRKTLVRSRSSWSVLLPVERLTGLADWLGMYRAPPVRYLPPHYPKPPPPM